MAIDYRTVEKSGNFWLLHAYEVIRSDYANILGGSNIAVKPKNLSKFGRTSNADSGETVTVARFQDDVKNETFSTTNDIDRIVSTSADDNSQTIRLEGHYYDDNNNLIFVVQDAVLNGQTPVTLGTAMCRATRAYVKTGTFASPATELAGDVAVYVNVADTNGKPNTDANVKIMILGSSDRNQSAKCATSISSSDFWIITDIAASLRRGNSNTTAADIDVEVREQGGVFRPIGLEMVVRTGGTQRGQVQPNPYYIVPPNSDVRMVANASADNTQVSGRMSGVLATIR